MPTSLLLYQYLANKLHLFLNIQVYISLHIIQLLCKIQISLSSFHVFYLMHRYQVLSFKFHFPQLIKYNFQMNLVDNFKLRAIIDESITSLRFLDTVKPQDDISSELAGFQISKLLKNQEDNQLKFAELVKKRANLTKITQKKQLEEIEIEIANLSMILKESTKKLCKLFKENPDLEQDSLKVIRQRRSLMTKLEELIQLIKNNTTQKFNSFITHELQNQDQLRKLLEKEKNLNIEIKKIQQEKNLQKKEFDKEIAENQAKIQQIKEDLMEIQQQTQIEISYFSKETKAQISNQTRIFDQSQKSLLTQIQNIKSFIRTETLVHKELEQYLLRKNSQIKKKSEQLTTKTEESKEKLQLQINQLNEHIQNTNKELQVFKKRYQEEEEKKLDRERKERNKLLEKQRKEEQLIRLHNAIKYIQNEYLAWKEAGGGKKKKKGKK